MFFSVFFIGDANRQISEYKFKLSKAEQEMGTMEQNVSFERFDQTKQQHIFQKKS